MAHEHTILEGTHDELTFVLYKTGKKRIRIGLAIHHVDCLRTTSENGLSVIDTVEPSRAFAATLGRCPVLVPYRLDESEDRFESEQAKRHSGPIGTEGEREVAEEALRSSPNQPAETLPLHVSWEVELRRVVHYQNPLVPSRAASRLPEVWRQNGLGRDAVVAEEAVGSLELSIVERLREAFSRPLS